jgi:hypothetical protein
MFTFSINPTRFAAAIERNSPLTVGLMTFESFKNSLDSNHPPTGIGDILLALWHAGKGDWEASHEIAQAANTPSHCLIHAYLHRKEGDNGNAKYWYTRAGQKMPQVSLEQEWENLVRQYLKG